ncbi:hypothetical protein LXD69_10155 [Flavobacterium sediminilitoris]|uniref:Uncharacterized protein n=1 Tax=Flavobacterium sediminilitoris TaxID=2024526 RepID=A0ABY4HHU4_9FLAO|nr:MULTISPECIES: hypothetical protein [Flavobacterium]UOX32414.1 hypothetical protein LXD69_10155 [Flavobacterium sediminilitoris]
MDAVTKWINNGCNYDEGVSLYETFPSHNKTLLKNFKRKQSIQLLEKLKYELKKFAKEVIEPTVKEKFTVVQKTSGQILSKNSIVQHIAQSSTSEQTKQALYFHELPGELRPVLLEANNLFKEMCFIKVELNDLPAHAEKKALELQIAISQKQKQNSNCWKKIDYWQKHRVAPKEKESKFNELAPAELLRKEQYLFASISKINKRLIANRAILKTISSLNESNRLHRAIAKQENSLIIKNDELTQIKALINGKG